MILYAYIFKTRTTVSLVNICHCHCNYFFLWFEFLTSLLATFKHIIQNYWLYVTSLNLFQLTAGNLFTFTYFPHPLSPNSGNYQSVHCSMAWFFRFHRHARLYSINLSLSNLFHLAYCPLFVFDFDNLIIICLSIVIFWFSLFGICWAPWI